MDKRSEIRLKYKEVLALTMEGKHEDAIAKIKEIARELKDMSEEEMDNAIADMNTMGSKF